MFKKIVSNLPFSPALVGQLGFYSKRLKQEEITRRLGLIFVAMALVVQSLVVFQPPESANASSPNDMIIGGIGGSLNNFLSPYDSNTRNLKDIMSYTGITREEIAAAQPTTWQSGEKLSWGFNSFFSYANGERQHNILDSNSQPITTIYSRPLKLWGYTDTQIPGWVGHSASMGWFGIMKDCGNLVTDRLPVITPPAPTLTPTSTPALKCLVNPKLLASDEECKPCPGNETLWVKDSSCIPNVIMSKVATNVSRGFVDAASIIATTGDQISYTLTIENTGLNITSPIKLMDNIYDALEYSTLVDNGGGILDNSNGVLSWPDITLAPKTKQTRTFVIKLLPVIPATAHGVSNPASFDCLITNTFGNTINTRVDCPTPKIIEQVTKELPKTGPTENLLFAGIVLSITTYFYARTRQVKKEVRLIRRDITTGTI